MTDKQIKETCLTNAAEHYNIQDKPTEAPKSENDYMAGWINGYKQCLEQLGLEWRIENGKLKIWGDVGSAYM